MLKPRLRVAVFDVDGTLVRPGDILSARALQSALISGYGLERVNLAALRREALTSREAVVALAVRHGLSEDEAMAGADGVIRLRDIFYGAAVAAGPAREGLAASPYARDFISALRKARVQLSLATGNSEFVARTKLYRAGLDPTIFAVGAFGDTPGRRDELVAAALDKMRIYSEFDISEVIVIGDCPADIRAGQSVGTRTLAVASGSFSSAELEAAGPDLLVDDLKPTARLMRHVLGAER